MHSAGYDEYMISLSRELEVCNGYVRKYRKVLKRMEVRFGFSTEVFLTHRRSGRLSETNDFAEWQYAAEAIRQWSSVGSEYQQLLDMFKGGTS